MRRALDFVLAIAILAAVGYGAYRLGHLVDNTSTQAGEASAGTTTTDATGAVTVVTHHSKGLSHRTIETIIVAIAVAAGVMLLVSLAGSLSRGKRRRQTWRAP